MEKIRSGSPHVRASLLMGCWVLGQMCVSYRENLGAELFLDLCFGELVAGRSQWLLRRGKQQRRKKQWSQIMKKNKKTRVYMLRALYCTHSLTSLHGKVPALQFISRGWLLPQVGHRGNGQICISEQAAGQCILLSFQFLKSHFVFKFVSKLE